MNALIFALKPRRTEFRKMLAQIFQFFTTKNDFGFSATGHATAF
jgi:hypothetical protein